MRTENDLLKAYYRSQGTPEPQEDSSGQEGDKRSPSPSLTSSTLPPNSKGDQGKKKLLNVEAVWNTIMNHDLYSKELLNLEAVIEVLSKKMIVGDRGAVLTEEDVLSAMAHGAGLKTLGLTRRRDGSSVKRD